MEVRSSREGFLGKSLFSPICRGRTLDIWRPFADCRYVHIVVEDLLGAASHQEMVHLDPGDLTCPPDSRPFGWRAHHDCLRLYTRAVKRRHRLWARTDWDIDSHLQS